MITLWKGSGYVHGSGTLHKSVCIETDLKNVSHVAQFRPSGSSPTIHFKSLRWPPAQFKVLGNQNLYLHDTYTERYDWGILSVLVIANIKLKGQLYSSNKAKVNWEFQKYLFSFKITHNEIYHIMIYWADCLADLFAYILFQICNQNTLVIQY